MASVAVVVGSSLPMGAHSEPVAKPVVQRITSTPKPVPVFTPKRLVISKIGVEGNVVPVGTEADGKMASPGTADDVGWWAGRKAGEGNLLLDGHHDWNGKVGVFYRLEELKPGDTVEVHGSKDSQKLVYRIIWVKNYDRKIDATDLLGNKENKQVATLITCGGTFDTIARTHRERIVARAELVTT